MCADLHLSKGAFAEVSTKLVMSNRSCAIRSDCDFGQTLALMHRTVRSERILPAYDRWRIPLVLLKAA